MRINFAHRRRIQALAALLVFTFCLNELPARTQGREGGIVQMVDFHFICGIVPGQKARITVANKDDSEPIATKLTVFDMEGNQLAQRETIVPPNGFSYMEADRDEFALRGEPDGRLQLHAIHTLFVREHNRLSVSLVSAEIIDKSKGQDSIWVDIGSPILTSLDGRKYVPDGTSNTIALGEALLPLLGLAPGQKARFSAVNDNSETSQAIKVTLRIWDAEGHQITEREMVIPPSRSGYIDVTRDEIALPGESPTGRLQLGATFTLSFQAQLSGLPHLIPVSVEIVQQGKTVAMIPLLAAVQNAREARGRP
jgi:hypothetical protein